MAGKQIVKSTKQNMSDEILLCQIKEQKTMPEQSERDIQAERTDIGIKTKQKNLSLQRSQRKLKSKLQSFLFRFGTFILYYQIMV